jgi:rhodanese-related sulfurtransferase
MGSSVSKACLLVVLSAGVGLLFNAVSPRGIPILPPPKAAPKPEEFLSLEQARELWNSGAAVFLDARAPDDYAAGHIPNALNLPALRFEEHFPQVSAQLTADLPLVVYCDGEECELSHRLKELLAQVGYTNVVLLHNGWTTWRQAGLPTQEGGGP